MGQTRAAQVLIQEMRESFDRFQTMVAELYATDETDSAAHFTSRPRSFCRRIPPGAAGGRAGGRIGDLQLAFSVLALG